MGEAEPVGKVAGDDSTQAKDEKLEQPEVVRFSPEEEAVCSRMFELIMIVS